MATAAPIALAAPAGATLYAGKFAAGLFGSADLADVVATGALGNNAADLAGSILLDEMLPTGGLGMALGNVQIAIWGQSNAVGTALRAELAAAPLSADPDLADYDANTLTFDRVRMWNGSAYVQLVMGSNNYGSAADKFGVEFGLAVRWMRETTEGTLYLIKQASGGVSITSFDPAPAALNWSNGNYEWGEAATWLAGQGVTLAARHWVWVQGESDEAQTQAWYQDRLQEILDALHSGGRMADPASRAVLSQMHPSTGTYGAGVAAAKTAIAGATPSRFSDIQFPGYIQGDNIHYNARGMVQHAYDCFAFLFDAPDLGT